MFIINISHVLIIQVLCQPIIQNNYKIHAYIEIWMIDQLFNFIYESSAAPHMQYTWTVKL